MNPGKCVVVCRNDHSTEGAASLPRWSPLWNTYGGHRVRLRREGLHGSEFLITVSRPAKGDQVFVSPGVLGMADGDTADGEIAVASRGEERRHRLLATTNGRLALSGLGLAIAAELVKVSLVIGKEYPWITVGDTGAATLTALATAMTVVGLILVTWKGFLSGN